jgi:YegS/Rv2252/BmrU family lipid kinase
MKKAKLIINPKSGRMQGKLPPIAKWSVKRFLAMGGHRETVEEIIKVVTEKCERAKIKLDVEITKYPKHAIEIARGARDKYDLVIVAGGDGTINEAINGIANSRTTLAVIPFGTANVFALELGIPLDAKEASELITKGEKIEIDLGYAETKEEARYYSMVLEAGFSAIVTKDATSEFRKKWGGLAYPILGIEHLVTYKWPKIYVKHGSTSTGYFVIIANSRLIWGEHQVADAASMTDGRLDLVIIDRKEWWSKMDLLFSLYSGRHNKFLPKEYCQIKEARVYSRSKIMVEADGEMIGTAPVKVKVVPKALSVIAKKGWRAGGYKYAS